MPRRFRAIPTVLGCFLLLASMLTLPHSALAHAQLHPALFALAPADFPSGSTIIRSQIESNRLLLQDQPDHFGPRPAVVALGRMTGYYMHAVQDGMADQWKTHTWYLVSIFRSAHLAFVAFDVRWSTWFEANYYTSPPPPPVTLRGKGEEGYFRRLDPSQTPLSEVMVRRGSVLIEVLQSTTVDPPTDDQVHAFWSIATKLNAIARAHSHGS